MRRHGDAVATDGAFQGLRAGIAEEGEVGEGRRAEPVGEFLGARDAIEVRDVPELLGLLGHRLDQCWMRMTQRVDRDA